MIRRRKRRGGKQRRLLGTLTTKRTHRRSAECFEVLTERSEGTYLDHINNQYGGSMLAVLNNCIQQLKDDSFAAENKILKQITGLRGLVVQKLIDAECETEKEFSVPVAVEEGERTVACQFCGEPMLQSKLSDHQKQDCNRLNLVGLTPNDRTLEPKSLYRIIRQGIVCSLCDIICSTISDKISHCDSFGHLTRALDVDSGLLATIYCVLCHDIVPNNNVQCYYHIQSKTHRRLQVCNEDWYSLNVRYHSLFSYVRCISCRQNMFEAKRVVEHHQRFHSGKGQLRLVRKVWCQVCNIRVDIDNWENHSTKCDKLSAKAFYCQLCNATVKGGSDFVSHVNECLEVSTVNELDLQEEFSNSFLYCQRCNAPVKVGADFVSHVEECQGVSTVNELDFRTNTLSVDEPSKHSKTKKTAGSNLQPSTSLSSYKTTHSKNEKTDDLKSKSKERSVRRLNEEIRCRNTSSSAPTSKMNLWCNCCGSFCSDLIEHYKHSCRPIVNKVTFSIAGPPGKCLFTIHSKGIVCNCCNSHLTNISQKAMHETESHLLGNVSELNNAYIFCSVCQDFIPSESIMVTRHALSKDHQKLKDLRVCQVSYTYLLLFYRYRCLPCRKNLFTVKQLQSHHTTEHNSSFASVWCQSCCECFDIDDVVKHRKGEIHKQWNQREMSCLLCQELVVGYQNLLSHIRSCRTRNDTKFSSNGSKRACAMSSGDIVAVTSGSDHSANQPSTTNYPMLTNDTAVPKNLPALPLTSGISRRTWSRYYPRGSPSSSFYLNAANVETSSSIRSVTPSPPPSEQTLTSTPTGISWRTFASFHRGGPRSSRVYLDNTNEHSASSKLSFSPSPSVNSGSTNEDSTGSIRSVTPPPSVNSGVTKEESTSSILSVTPPTSVNSGITKNICAISSTSYDSSKVSIPSTGALASQHGLQDCSSIPNQNESASSSPTPTTANYLHFEYPAMEGHKITIRSGQQCEEPDLSWLLPPPPPPIPVAEPVKQCMIM